MSLPDETPAFDAFISYRHKQPDMRVAERIQNLLERYRAPKGLGRRRLGPIFRDKTELPTGNDLGESIREAIRNSRFLIVVLSEDTKHSMWCMEEIRYFKELHEGRIDHILPVLVCGEPEDVLPESLRYEHISVTEPDGTERIVEREVEPLIGDIRADSKRGRMKNMKTEYLRLAAQILQCRFDDLYQRQHRHERRVRTAVGAGVGGLLTATLAVVSLFAYRAHVSELQYRRSLVAQLIQRGAENDRNADKSAALLYYTRALEIDPENETAAAGALLALQSARWVAGQEVEDAALQPTAPPNMDRFGTCISTPDDSGQDVYVYQDGSRLTLFLAEEERLLSVLVPEAENPNLLFFDKEAYAEPGKDHPFAQVVCRNDRRAVAVTYGGYAYCYSFDSADTADKGVIDEGTLEWTLDLYEAYDQPVGGWISFNNPIRVSSDNDIAVIWDEKNTSSLCVADLFEKRLLCRALPFDTRHVSERCFDTLEVAPDGSGFALFVKESFSTGRGSEVHVVDADGTLRFRTARVYSDTPVCLRYSENMDSLLVLRRGSVELWSLESGLQTYAPVPVNDAADARFRPDGEIEIIEDSGRVTVLSELGFRATESDSAPKHVRGDGIYQKDGRLYSLFDAPSDATYLGSWVDERTFVTVNNDFYDSCIKLMDVDGSELDRIPLPDHSVSYVAWVDAELPVVYFTADPPDCDLYRCAIDVQAHKLGKAETMDSQGMVVSGGIPHLGGGCAFYTPDMRMVYYAGQALQPTTVTELGEGMLIGDGAYFAAAGSGRVVMDILRPDEEALLSASIELWDLGAGLCLGTIGRTDRATKVGSLPDGSILVRTYDDSGGDGELEPYKEKRFCLTAPPADREALDALYGLCSQAWSDTTISAVQTPAFNGSLGSWRDSVEACEDGGFQPVQDE